MEEVKTYEHSHCHTGEPSPKGGKCHSWQLWKGANALSH